MPIQDRTNEFRACVESIRSRSAAPARVAEQRQRLLQQRGKENAKNEFTRMADAIGRDISATTLKLNKLAQREYCFLETLKLQSNYSHPYPLFAISCEAKDVIR